MLLLAHSFAVVGLRVNQSVEVHLHVFDWYSTLLWFSTFDFKDVLFISPAFRGLPPSLPSPYRPALYAALPPNAHPNRPTFLSLNSASVIMTHFSKCQCITALNTDATVRNPGTYHLMAWTMSTLPVMTFFTAGTRLYARAKDRYCS